MLSRPAPLPTSAVVVTGPVARSSVEALSRALQTPTPERFQGGVLVYTALPGVRYRIDLAVDRLTTLRFAPGETLFSVAAGLPHCETLKTDDPEIDRRCLAIQETTSGAETSLQAHVLIRPGREGLRTNAMVTTSAGAYDLELVSRAHGGIPVVMWETPMPLETLTAPTLEVLGVGYTITPRRTPGPVWQPLAMWDDTRHTYLRFPETIGAMGLPLLYEVTPSGEEHLVNYRADENGRLVIADGVFDGAVLRVGSGATAALVDLRRHTGYRYVTCPGAECPEGWQAVRR
jgi:type IV secretion system protein VirB9